MTQPLSVEPRPPGNHGSQPADEVLRVASGTNPKDVASAIFHGVEQGRLIVLRAIGAGSVNQAVKAIAIARGHVALIGLDLYCNCGFVSVVGNQGDELNAIVFRIFTR